MQQKKKLIFVSSRYLFIGFVLLISHILQGQDYHFSQFYNTPLNTNPAFTGRTSEDYRINLIHRSQWQSLNAPFATSSFAGDMNFYKNPFRADKVGGGLVVVNDQLGNGIFSNQLVMASGAWHKSLDDEKRHRLSIGIQIGWGRKSVNTENLIFSSQLNPNTNNLDPSLSSGENLSNLGYNYLNINSGAFYDFLINNKVDVFGGFGVFNLTRPKEGFIVNASDRLAIRWNINVGVTYKLSKKVSIVPQILYTNQASTIDFDMGANVNYSLFPKKSNNTFVLTGGAWYRLRDAAIGYVGVKYNGLQVGFSYDFTVSNLNTIIPEPGKRYITGAWEISLIYTGFLNRAIPSDLTVPCRIF